MNIKHWKKSWRDYTPSSLNWLEKVKITKATVFDRNSAYIACITKDKNNKDNWQLQVSGLSAEFCQKATDQAKKLGWKAKSPITLLVDETPVILVSPSALDVSTSQKGRQAGLDAAPFIKQLACEKVGICSNSELTSLDILDGLTQGLYSLTTFKGPKKDNDKDEQYPASISLFETSLQEEDIARSLAFAKALMLTKWLEDAPPNWLTPERFGQIAQDLSAERGLKCKVRGREEIEAMGMGCFASVAGGTKLDPKFIMIEVDGEDNNQTIALVGKGLTFDSGGISIKGSQGMEEMKYDMCGGASVLGTAYFLSYFRPKTKVVCMIGAVENMPGENATRPSDIVTAYNKKTVEILNTDAEGRLVLCDLLAYAADDLKPALIVDIATLTGAVVIALGSFGSAIMSNQQPVAEFVLNVSRKIGEPVWQMPLWPELSKEMQSDIADLKNIAAPNVKGGSIAAGQFLREFVGDCKWVHVDIAGTGWNCKATGYPCSGGSGFGVRLLSQICLQFNS